MDLPNHSPVIGYHDDCTDGFCAAWLLRGYFLQQGVEIECIPLTFNGPDQSFYDAILNKSVYLLDICFDAATLREIELRSESLTVVDHHATAEKALREWAPRWPGRAIFDRSHSAAVLTWFLIYGKPADMRDLPDLVCMVEDRDLWRWALPDSREFNAALRSLPHSFEVWDQIDYRVDFVTQGKAILSDQKNTINRIARHAELSSFYGYTVPVVNASCLVSEIGSALLAAFPDAPFSVVFEMRGGQIHYHLRSRGDFDVGDFASTLGGGGHVQAAGFRRPWDHWEICR